MDWGDTMARWAEMGSAAGKAITGLAEQYAHSKLLQMQGIPAKQAHWIATLPAEQQTPFVQAAWGQKAQPVAQPAQSQQQIAPQEQPSRTLGSVSPMASMLSQLQQPNLGAFQGGQGAKPNSIDSALNTLLKSGAPNPFIQGQDQNPITSQLLKGLSQLQQYGQSQGQQQMGRLPQQEGFPSPVAPQVNPLQQPQQQPMGPQQAQQQAQAPQTIEQALANVGTAAQQKPEKKLTVQEQKQRDAIQVGVDNLDDIIETADRMLEIVDQIDYGPLASVTEKISPSWLDTVSEQFSKDSSHILNLGSQEMKGVPSVYRVKTLAKEKPGLEHSPAVNRQILERLKRQAIHKKNGLVKKYSKYDLQTESSSAPVDEYQLAQQDPLEWPQFYENGSVFLNDDGSRKMLVNGEWEDF